MYVNYLSKNLIFCAIIIKKKVNFKLHRHTQTVVVKYILTPVKFTWKLIFN